MKQYKELGFRYFKYRKKRAVLVITSMVLATIFLYIAATVGMNVYKAQKNDQLAYANYQTVVYGTDDTTYENLKKHVNVDHVDRAVIEYQVEFKDFYGWDGMRMIHVESPDQTTFGYNITEGRFPKTSTEVMLTADASRLFGKTVKLGDKISTVCYDEELMETVVANEYTIVGFFTREGETDMNRIYTAFTIATKDMGLDSYVSLKNSWNWREDTRNMLKDLNIKLDANPPTHDVNYELGLFYGQMKAENAVLAVLMVGVAALLIYLCTVMVRSLFSTNMIDKMRDFSILKSMGATPKQLKKIFKTECYVEGLIAFVIGVILSHILMQIVFVNMAQIYFISFDFSIVALILAFIAMGFTISLAVLEPFGLLKKISIVEGVGQNYTIKSVKMKKHKSGIWKLFGVEGEYAYKNIRRNNKTFWGSVASFTISVVLLTLLSTALSNAMKMLNVEASGMLAEDNIFDIFCSYSQIDMGDDVYDTAKKGFGDKEYIKDYEPYNCLFCLRSKDGSILKLTDDAYAKLNTEFSSFSENVIEIHFYTDKQLQMLNEYMQDGVDALEATKNGGVLLVGNGQWYNPDKQDFETVKLHNEKVGDNVELPKISFLIDAAKKKDVTYTNIEIIKEVMDNPSAREAVKINGIVDRGIMTVSPVCATVIMSANYVERTYGKEFIQSCCSGYLVNIDDRSFDQADFAKTVYDDMKFQDWMFLDSERMVNGYTRGIKIVVYVIIIFTIIMGIVNVLHSMVNEQLARRREVSLLRAIGMSKRKLNKMLILEKLIVGITAWVIGTLLGVGISAMFLVPMLYAYELPIIFTWDVYLLTLVGMLAIMLFLSWIMISSLGKMSLTDNIRNNE